MKTIYLPAVSAILFSLGTGVAGAAEMDAGTYAGPHAELTAASSQQPILLSDSELDGVSAAGQFSSSSGIASALQGRAFSMSITRSISNRGVNITMSRSVARAVGVGAVAYTSAASGIN